MKFEIGDKIRIKKDIVVMDTIDDVTFVDDMLQYIGLTATIIGSDMWVSTCIEYYLDIDDDTYSWHQDWLETANQWEKITI